MKKFFAITAILIAILTFSTAAFATDAQPLEVITTAPAAETEAPADTAPEVQEPALTAPTEEQVQQGVTDWVDKLDESLAGIEIWETAKAWVLTNLSTVVGAIMAVATLIIGLATKFSFIPKIITRIQQFGDAIGEWYKNNTEQVKSLVRTLDDFLGEVRATIKTVAQQSERNKQLLEENARLYQEYIDARAQTNAVETALLEYAKLTAEEFEDLLQTSDLTKADLDAHYQAYKTKLELIEAAIAVREAEAREEAEV